MRLNKNSKEGVKAVCTPEKAVEWFNEEDKWVYAYESLNDVGNTYTLTDNPEVIDCLVGRVERYYIHTLEMLIRAPQLVMRNCDIKLQVTRRDQ